MMMWVELDRLYGLVREHVESLTRVQERCTAQELELRSHRAESRITGTPDGEFLLAAVHQLKLAREKHPGPFSRIHMLAVLAEEVGEVAKAVLDHESEERVVEELAQVVAACCRIVKEFRR